MKLSAFSTRLGQYLSILRINTVNTWQSDTAYFGNGWGNVLSTVTYTLTFIVFISVIYANVHTMAGYSRDQMIFLALIGQVNYYVTAGWCWTNIQRLIDDVNRGSLDLVLVKPLPALFYTSVRNISVLPQLRDGLPSLFFVTLAIHWQNITVSLPCVVSGIMIMILGQLAIGAFGFLLAAPVFWFGQASDSLNLGYVIFSGTDLPYEGVPSKLRLAMIYVIPVLIQTTIASSVMLGKLNPAFGLATALAAAGILVAAKVVVWKWALRNYTSASS